jgi:DNA-binding GntR family transcriptional regulator
VDKVAAELRRSILAGDLAPGQPFSITEISNDLGVSHIPVREALQRLESQGLIHMRAGRSAIVAPLEIEEVRSAFRLRRAIEVDLATQALRSHQPGDMSRLHDSFDAMSKSAPETDDLMAHHRAFHAGLLQPEATEWDLRILELLWQTTERYARLALPEAAVPTDEGLRPLSESHEPLLQAAVAGSVRNLKRHLQQHLQEAELAILEKVSGSRSASGK